MLVPKRMATLRLAQGCHELVSLLHDVHTVVPGARLKSCESRTAVPRSATMHSGDVKRKDDVNNEDNALWVARWRGLMAGPGHGGEAIRQNRLARRRDVCMRTAPTPRGLST